MQIKGLCGVKFDILNRSEGQQSKGSWTLVISPKIKLKLPHLRIYNDFVLY